MLKRIQCGANPDADTFEVLMSQRKVPTGNVTER